MPTESIIPITTSEHCPPRTTMRRFFSQRRFLPISDYTSSLRLSCRTPVASITGKHLLGRTRQLFESDRVKADRVIEDIIKDVDFDFSAYDRDSSPDPDQFILSKRKSCRGDKSETSKRKRIDSDFNSTLKKLMEEDRKKMIANKSGRSPVVQKNSRKMKKKMQANKKRKKAAREIHEERADEDMNDLLMFANEEETCLKILDMNIDTNSKKKRLSSEEKKKKKKTKHVKSYKPMKNITKQKKGKLYIEDCGPSDNDEDSSAKMLDMEDESVADKKHTVEEEKKSSPVKKKKNKIEGKSYYDHDETNINHLIRHRSGIPTYNQATRFGVVQFNHAVSIRIKESIFGHFYGVPDFKIRARLLDDLIGRYAGRYSFNINGKILEFSVAEFGQILGIPYRGVDVEMKRKAKSSSDWSLRHFAADCDIRREVVVKVIVAIN